jgi:hypothetical protein
MYGGSMRPYMFNHFSKVAAAMNNYVAASSRSYYQNQYYRNLADQRDFIVVNQRPPLFTSGLSGLIAYGLHTIGLPPTVVNFGYRIGYFLDVNS